MPLTTNTSIAARDRLIVALDFATRAEAFALVDRLGECVSFYKVGMELLTSGDYFAVIEALAARGKRVFADLKFFDIPATVASAVRGLARYPVEFATIHGNDGMMRAAAKEKGTLKLLAVTALTSLDEGDLRALGFEVDVHALVLSRAKAALAAGCDGVVSSGLEVAALRAEVDARLLVVCPGIRPVANSDDQQRTVDVRAAFENGADYIVVGRPIRDASDPWAAAKAIQATIAEVFPAA
ncbi:MAG TPA: orotidine-5'-phosphate decarboxylase [Candidatus Saccharimonadia bacterium]|nr:orotidine-5'-phosphate decarboxylase [Candidatus Saccharimonadia bacterium]